MNSKNNNPNFNTTLAEDIPTKIANLGWRVGYTCFAWLILGFGITPGTGFFVATMLFSIPLYIEYLKFNAGTKFRFLLHRFAKSYLFLLCLFSLAGMAGIIVINLEQSILYASISNSFIIMQGLSVKLMFIWVMVGICVVFTFIDWIIYDNLYEKSLKSNKWNGTKKKESNT